MVHMKAGDTTVVSRRSSCNKPQELGASLLVELRLFWLLCFLQQMGINVTSHRNNSYVYGNPRGLQYDRSRLQHHVSKPIHRRRKNLVRRCPNRSIPWSTDSAVGEKSAVATLCRIIFGSVGYEICLFSAGTSQYWHKRSRVTRQYCGVQDTALLFYYCILVRGYAAEEKRRKKTEGRRAGRRPRVNETKATQKAAVRRHNPSVGSSLMLSNTPPSGLILVVTGGARTPHCCHTELDALSK